MNDRKRKAVLFDADGTLINHKECERQALVRVFEGLGFAYKDEYQDIFRPLDIFRTLLERLALKPDDVIMVGDRLEKDILGAANAGIKSVWFNPEHEKNDTEIRPDYIIHDLMQVSKILNAF
ncbi:MAG: HAD hydrolase-like protein [Defluviitaleaceae bacterium]|nr:HAD hydrolase-like protein [Defluviitaleaceae bacterium]